jgi:hypothetical protein
MPRSAGAYSAPNTPTPLFALGTVVATHGALAALRDAGLSPLELLGRHAAGDWGEIHPDDHGLNEWAIVHDARILSVYPLATGETIWIITEADRRVTTQLLPSEY